MVNLIALLPALGKIIEKVIPDPNKAQELKNEIMVASLNADSELYKAKGSIVTAEVKGESWMQRNWRPITMLTFVFIIANNYIIAPYAGYISSIFGWADEAGNFLTVPVLSIPDGMWGLLQIGIGGYIASRGVEKVTGKVQQGGVPLIGAKKTQINPNISKDELLAALKSAS